jgi:hypothetical protein
MAGKRRGSVRTSKRMAKKAARALRNRRSSAPLKSLAGSVLANRAGR